MSIAKRSKKPSLELADLVDEVVRLAKPLELKRPLVGLSLADHDLQVFGEQVDRVLDRERTVGLWELLEALPALVALGYVATYAALRHPSMRFDAWAVSRIERWVERIEVRQGRGVASLLERAANNWVRVGHAFDGGEDRTHAMCAARIMSLACQRKEASAAMWLHASTFLGWAGATLEALDTAKRGWETFNRDPRLLANVLTFALLAGDSRTVDSTVSMAVQSFLAAHEEAMVAPLVGALTSLGRANDALEVLWPWIEQRELSPEQLSMVVRLVNEHGRVEQKLSLLEYSLDEIQRRRVFAQHIALAEGVCELLDAVGQRERVDKVIEAVQRSKTELSASLALRKARLVTT